MAGCTPVMHYGTSNSFNFSGEEVNIKVMTSRDKLEADLNREKVVCNDNSAKNSYFMENTNDIFEF